MSRKLQSKVTITKLTKEEAEKLLAKLEKEKEGTK